MFQIGSSRLFRLGTADRAKDCLNRGDGCAYYAKLVSLGGLRWRKLTRSFFARLSCWRDSPKTPMAVSWLSAMRHGAGLRQAPTAVSGSPATTTEPGSALVLLEAA